MGFAGAIQLIFDIFAGVGIFVLLLKLARAPKDDPRLSRGLQMLQSKIAILEDLSDRTENQVRGLISLLDQKNIDVQTRIDRAAEQVRIVEDSIRSSMDVAKIFQDKIPHQEIIERQNTLKYLQAAKLANQGYSLEQIAGRVDLPMGELEFIVKVNREQLTFSVEDLPAWAKAELSQMDEPVPQNETQQPMTSHPYTSDFNYLANSNDHAQYSQDIAPLAAFASEPQFQPFQNSVSRPNFIEETAPQRELTAEDSKQINTLKRTQSIIANLDRQFASAGEEETEPATKSFEKLVVPPVVSAPTMTAAKTPQTSSLGTYDSATIRRVVFPTIQAQKANQRSAGK